MYLLVSLCSPYVNKVFIGIMLKYPYVFVCLWYATNTLRVFTRVVVMVCCQQTKICSWNLQSVHPNKSDQ